MKASLLLVAVFNSNVVVSILQSPFDNDGEQCVGYSIDFERLQTLSSSDIESLIGGDPLQPRHDYSLGRVQNIVNEDDSNSLFPSKCMGSRHRLQEVVEGVPVYGADILVTVGTCITQDTDFYRASYNGNILNTLNKSGGSIQSLSGKTFTSMNVNTEMDPSKTKQEASEAIAALLGIDRLKVGDPELELFISTGGDFLAYRSYCLVEKGSSTDLLEIVIDAHDLTILSRCSLARDASKAFQQRRLGSDQKQRNLQFNCESCANHSHPIIWTGGTTSCRISSLYLDNTQQSTTCTEGVNLNGYTDAVGPGPVEELWWTGTLDCNSGTVCTAVELPTCRDAISDIQFAGVEALKLLQEELGVMGGLSADPNSPVPVKAYAHYEDRYCNAFYSPATNSVYFGDCNCHTWAPLVALDIVGHELFHGITRHSSGLVYSGESGGLNEAFSDIFGTVLEFSVNDYEDPPDFTIAEEAGGVLRNMEAPIHKSIHSVCDFYDGMNVHYSSGALNKAYVKAVRACEDDGCDNTMNCALTIGKLFLYTNINGLTSTSDFVDAATASCVMIEEFLTVRRPTTGCSASDLKGFIRDGWATVDVAISDTCNAFNTCFGTNITPEPTAQPLQNSAPTRAPDAPRPTPNPGPILLPTGSTQDGEPNEDCFDEDEAEDEEEDDCFDTGLLSLWRRGVSWFLGENDDGDG